MRLNSRLRLAFPGLVIAVLCLNSSPILAQASPDSRVDAATEAALQGRAVQSSGNATGAQPAAPVITLDPPTGLDLLAHTMDSKGNPLPEAPPNFRRLGEATMGTPADLHTLTLRFHQATRITAISVSKDFKVEQGGSCVEGNVYETGTTCRLLVRFTPQGPGNRLGKLTVSHSASATPDAFGLGGLGYAPVLSFIPSGIWVVQGQFSGAQNLAIDGSDTLWVADTKGKTIWYIDSSGSPVALVTNQPAPWGIAVDTFGDAFFSSPSTNTMYTIPAEIALAEKFSGTGAGACTEAAPCKLGTHSLSSPGELSMDPNNRLFWPDLSSGGAAFSTVQPAPASLVFLLDPFYSLAPPTSAVAVDSGDNLYSFLVSDPRYPWQGVCQIIQQTFYNAEHLIPSYTKVAGDRTCGFSGDGGLAGNAEIGSSVSQIAFDAAGDLYFTDTANERVRRIDYNTGIIRTIAGNGLTTTGGVTLGSPATSVDLNSPTGVGVDSQGQVYIVANSGQIVYLVGTAGVVSFGNQLKGKKSNASLVVVTNTGNSAMDLTNTAMVGANPGDFSVDPTTTDCVLTPGAALASGQTCRIGFVFTPSVKGSRSASFVLHSNTVNGQNTINLAGTGTVPNANFAITEPLNNSSFASNTSFTFSVSVTSPTTGGPVPTGTVKFSVDSAVVATNALNGSGNASTTITAGNYTHASHKLYASYSGDSNYAAGGPITVTVTITSAASPPIVTLAPVSTTPVACIPMSFNVAVTSHSGFVPTGPVRLMLGTITVASGALVGGKATLTTPPLRPGIQSFTAQYGGDAHDPAASSAPMLETVRPGGPCIQPEDPPVAPR